MPASQIATTPSNPAVTSVRPSGAKQMLRTGLSWTPLFVRYLPLRASHMPRVVRAAGRQSLAVG